MPDIENILFFGTPCGFANQVMSRLVEDGYNIAAQITPGDPSAAEPIVLNRQESNSGTGNRLPMARQGDAAPVQLGPHGRIQVNRHSDQETVRTLQGVNADLAVVCCYPRRIPLSLIQTPTFGGVNVHPSLLPDYRGPDPLFWAYRNGETRTGVTVHHVVRSLDTGPIIGQTAIDLPIGAPGDAIWDTLARTGAELLLTSIQRIRLGNGSECQQDARTARYFSWPDERDLVIDPAEWEAWRVYHFCRGVLPLGHIPLLRQGKGIRRIRSVEHYVNGSRGTGPLDPVEEWIPCQDGAVRASLGPTIF